MPDRVRMPDRWSLRRTLLDHSIISPSLAHHPTIFPHHAISVCMLPMTLRSSAICRCLPDVDILHVIPLMGFDLMLG